VLFIPPPFFFADDFRVVVTLIAFFFLLEHSPLPLSASPTLFSLPPPLHPQSRSFFFTQCIVPFCSLLVPAPVFSPPRGGRASALSSPSFFTQGTRKQVEIKFFFPARSGRPLAAAYLYAILPDPPPLSSGDAFACSFMKLGNLF